uniref:BZIP domain-containing protein n=1 Tax=Gouania willdenowi TaxID=441366 RepID=A0A8C5D069_GOUWI
MFVRGEKGADTMQHLRKWKQKEKCHHSLTEDESEKKKRRLQKNKEAAHVYRKKQKDLFKYLTDRAAMLEKENNTMMEEIQALKAVSTAKTKV